MAKTRAKKQTSKKTSKKATGKKGTCFAIMPFGGWFDDYYSTIFVPAIEKAGLESCRADDLYRPSTIVADIWNYTKQAKLVIADLSEKNPNVFYELGLAHALAKPAILVVESIDDVPFDLRALRVLEYDKNDSNWGVILRNKIVKAIGEVLADPAQSVPTAFLETKPERGTPAITEHEKELLTIREDLDLLRREVRVRTRSTRERIIPGPDEAREELEHMLDRGFPRSIIRKRLRDRRVPSSWIDRELEIISPAPVRTHTARTVSPKPSEQTATESKAPEAAAETPATSAKATVERKTTKRKVAKKKAPKRKVAS